MLKQLVSPHGGTLKPLLLEGEARNEALEHAKTLPVVDMTSREVSDLIMLAIGAFSPLDGFMRQADYKNVVDNMEMADGTFWPIPITLSVPQKQADELPTGSEVALRDTERDEIMGIMTIDEKYTYDKEHEAKEVFGTTEAEHPGVKKVYDQHEVLIGGPVKALSEGPYPDEYGDYYARPAETRKIFEERGWKRVTAFQTRNPMHRSHEYLAKVAMEISDGVLIHPLVGKLKKGDVPAETRMKCYEVLFDNYYPKERVALKVYPMEMRYGGPREALLHAVFRQNYGCSHLIIGRDHAGVGDYYGAFDAQDIFDEIPHEKLEIQPLKMDWTFWCHACGEMASMKTCPHDKEHRVLLSGTKLREMLSNGERPPKEYSRKEVIDILMEFYQSQNA